VISELGKGEALVSFLEGKRHAVHGRARMVRPPSARVGPVTPEERRAIMMTSPVKGKYDVAIDSESAYEVLLNRVQKTGSTSRRPPGSEQPSSAASGLDQRHWRRARGRLRYQPPTRTKADGRPVCDARRDALGGEPGGGQGRGDIGKSMAGSMGNTIGRAIVRGTWRPAASVAGLVPAPCPIKVILSSAFAGRP